MSAWSRRTVITAVVLGLVAVVLFTLMRGLSASEDAAAAISTGGAVAFALFAAMASWSMAARLQRGEPLRLQVIAIGFGMVALVSGDVLYWLNESVFGIEPYPSLADVFYVASFPLIGGGLLLALRGFMRGQKPVVPLAASALVTGGATFAAWRGVLAPVLEDAGVPPLEKALGAFYPLGDLWLLLFPALALAFALTRFAGGRLATPWVIVAFGALAMAVTDTAYTWLDYAGTYVSGSLIDVGWWVAYAAIGLGLVTLAEVQGVRGGRSRER